MKLDEYDDYELEIGYFIVHYIGNKGKVEERVGKDEFVSAIEKLIEAPNRPYSILFKYYVKTGDMDFQEVSKEIYAELYQWKTRLKNRQRYLYRRYRDNFFDGNIEDIPSNFNLEKEVIHIVQDEILDKKLRRVLTEKQYLIFYNWYYNGLSKSEIARNTGVTRQAINANFQYIIKKIKEILK